MQTYPAAPPTPLFGILTSGLVLIIVYAFVRLSSEGEGWFNVCKKAISLGTFGMAIIALLETLNYWNWSLQVHSANPIAVYVASMIIVLLLIAVPWVDLAVQWYFVKR